MADTQKTAPRATGNRSTTPASTGFQDFISAGWAERTVAVSGPRDAASAALEQRERISALHPGARLVIPAGSPKQRSNDTDYPYRAHSAFAHLTGWGADTVAESVLVMEPTANGHTATLYFREAAGRDSDEFYANPEIGEFWTGARPGRAEVAADLGLEARGLAELDTVVAAISANAASANADIANADIATLLVREADRDLTDTLDAARFSSAEGTAGGTEADEVLARDLSEMRLVKNEWEIEQLREAVDATRLGFNDVIADLPQIIAHERGERLVEGTFNRRAHGR
jgi:Xaa-Pro aminopeptidase